VEEDAMSMTRREVLAAAVAGGLVAASAAQADEKKPRERPTPLTPEQVEKDRPDGEVSVTFAVEEVGLLRGPIEKGDPPYMPISLGTKAGLKDRRSKLYIVLVGKALVHVHDLGISDPTAHFRGRSIEVKGKVQYASYPRVTKPNGAVEVQADNYPQYEIVIDSLDNFRVVK
jgi:hypothetical protein